MPDATARVLIDDVHQFGDGVAPVALHMPRHPARGGDELAIDHRHDGRRRAAWSRPPRPIAGIGGLERGGDAVLGCDVDRNATAVIAASSGLMTTG